MWNWKSTGVTKSSPAVTQTRGEKAKPPVILAAARPRTMAATMRKTCCIGYSPLFRRNSTFTTSENRSGAGPTSSTR